MITLERGCRRFIMISFPGITGRIYGPRCWEWILTRSSYRNPDLDLEFWDFRLATPLFFAVLWGPKRRVR